MALTDKQQRFVEEYMVDLNATQAAIRAGYKPNNADKIGHELLGKTLVYQAIKKLQTEVSKRTDITIDRVLNEYAKIAFADVRDLLTIDGGLKSTHEWNDSIAGAVASIELYEEFSPDGEQLGTNKKVKLNDKLRALDAIGKHLGFFEKDNDQKKNDLNINAPTKIVFTKNGAGTKDK